MLTVENISSGYTKIEVLHQVSLTVHPGEIVSVVGPNGAGKSTLMNTISGLLRCKGGRIVFQDEDVTNWAAEKLCARGIVQVPEGRQVFAPLTVYENLRLGTYGHRKELSKAKSGQLFDFVYALYPILADRKKQLAGTLSGGEQQALAIARALMGQPQLLLLDEPSLGLAPKLIAQTYGVLRRLNEGGLTVLLVEQKARLALDIANRMYVMETGRVVLEGTAAEIRHNEKAVEAYFG